MEAPSWLQLRWGARAPECIATDARSFLSPPNFPKEVHFSPDGTSLLASAEDASVHVYNLPVDRLDGGGGAGAALAPALTLALGEPVYSADWWPRAGAAPPPVLTATRGRPAQLWDSCVGRLRASYVCHDDNDNPAPILCARFDRDPGAARVVLGLERRIAVFDAHRPGRHDLLYDVRTDAADGGQRGAVSCLDTSDTGSALVAAGSFDRSLGLYDMRAGCAPQLVIHGAHAGGLTHLRFSRCGNFLYSGARRDARLRCWDARSAAGSVYSLPRESGETNQRIGFDIEPCGRHLLSGGARGVRVYDLATGERVVAAWAAWGPSAVGGVSVHPQLPLVATASGERRAADGGRGAAPAAGGNSEVAVWACDYVYGEIPAADAR